MFSRISMVVRNVLVLGLVLGMTSGAMAAKLGKSDVQSLIVGHRMSFTAGSKASFGNDGKFSFKHSSGTERGSYSIGGNGAVSLNFGSRVDVFVVDITGNKKKITYTKGKYKGKSFTFR